MKIPTLLALAALLAAGCASASPPHATHATSAPVPVATPSPSCRQQILTWRSSGGLRQLQTVGADLAQAQLAGMSGNLGSMQGAMTTLAADSRTALTGPPPSCVPNLAADYSTAMNDFISAASSVNQGNISSIQAATAQTGAGGKAIRRAIRDISKWEADGMP